MRISFRYILSSILSLMGMVSYSQELPSLPMDPAIVSGTLPSGVEYYLLKDASVKGFADIALVQKGRDDIDGARQALKEISDFMTTKGVGYGPEGFISWSPEGAVFRFRKVPVFDKVTSDSTFVLLTDVMRSYPASQALMVSGDIDTKKLSEQLYMYSLMVPKRSDAAPEDPYEWNEREGVCVAVSSNGLDETARIGVEYKFARPQEGLMATVQPLVTRKFALKAFSILSRRLRDVFYREDIPMDGFSCRYKDASLSGEDESFSFSFNTGANFMEQAVSLVAGTLSSLDRYGASEYEYESAPIRRIASKGNVDKMISSYLYGSNMASDEEINGFFERRTLSVGQEIDLFNGFLDAMLDSEKNLTLSVSAPEIPDRDNCLKLFREAWMESDSSFVLNGFGDLSAFKPVKEPRKVKKTAVLKDPVTGGEIWTFSNGFKVIYRQIPDNGRFEYSLLLCGGISEIKGLKEGESAFVSDVSNLFSVAGMSPYQFRDVLRSSDIDMKIEVGLSDLRLVGSAPEKNLEDVLNILSSYGYRRTFNSVRLDYYRSCVGLAVEDTGTGDVGTMEFMEDLGAGDYRYMSTKIPDNLDDGLPSRVDRYVSAQFAKTGDGVLILIGDLDPLVVENVLSKKLGSFTVGRQYSHRPKVQGRAGAKWLTYSGFGRDGECIDVLLGVDKPFSLRNYIVFQLACIALERHLSTSLADKGIYADVSADYGIMPDERLNVLIRFRSCTPDGLPSGTSPTPDNRMLSSVRKEIFGLSEIFVGEETFRWCKDNLKNRRSRYLSEADGLMRYALFRNSEGKDLISGYDEELSAVTSSEVEALLHSLQNGYMVEFVER